MFFSNVELFWYEFRIRNCKNVAKKSFGIKKIASQMTVATDNVM